MPSIKKIKDKVKKLNDKINNKGVTTNVLKDTLGKNGVLVECCALYEDAPKDFHDAAAAIRASYKACKFVSIQKYVPLVHDDSRQLSEACEKIKGIEDKIKTARKGFRRDICAHLENQTRELLEYADRVCSGNGGALLQRERVSPCPGQPCASRFRVVETGNRPVTDSVVARVEQHNSEVDSIFESEDALSTDLNTIFRALTPGQVYRNRISEKGKKALKAGVDKARAVLAEEIHDGRYLDNPNALIGPSWELRANPDGLGGDLGALKGGIIGLIEGGLILLGTPFFAAFKCCVAACQRAQGAVARLGFADKYYTTLHGLLKEYEHVALDLTKKQKALRHTASFLLKDMQGLQALGDCLMSEGGRMLPSLAPVSRDPSKNDIKKCCRDVVQLIITLGEKLKDAGQANS